VISQRIRASVLADDPVTLCGLTVQLRASTALDVVAFRGDELPEVVVIGAACLDAEQLRRVRAVQYGGRTRVVAVVGELDGASMLEAVEAGASVILRRREATDERLAESVRMASTGERSMPSDLLSRLMRLPSDDGERAADGWPSGLADPPHPLRPQPLCPQPLCP
jgi:DNA-binding NarL/FixJ family response regulator